MAHLKKKKKKKKKESKKQNFEKEKHQLGGIANSELS
jgi:hypothetical protein